MRIKESIIGFCRRPTSVLPPTFADGIVVTVARFFGAAALAINGIAVARLLGPEGRGQFASLWTVANLCVLFTNLGLPISNACRQSKARKQHAQIDYGP